MRHTSLLLLLVATAVAGCGDDTNSGAGGGGGGGGGDDAGATTAATTASTGGEAAPPIAESCKAVCDKKRAATCAADGPLDGCEDECVAANTSAGCQPETDAYAACIAAGNVVCSVDDESTPVAPCGDETRTLSACLAANP